VRYPVRQLRGSGTQLMRCDRDNRVVGAVLCQPDDELLLLTADGYGRKTLASWIEIPEKENAKGKVHIARQSPVVGIANGRVWAVTNQRIVVVEDEQVILENSTKTTRLLKLAEAEQVVTLLAN